MKIRLNKVQKELNLGLSTIVEFLQKNNFEIEENPNAVVPEEGYNLLIKEFSTDKNLRIQSDKFTQERQNKEKVKSATPESRPQPKAAVAEEVVSKPKEQPKAEEKPVVEAEEKKADESPIKIKVVRRIDLDAFENRGNQQQNKEKQQPKKEEQQPKKEEPAPQPVAEKVVEPSPAPQPAKKERYSLW